MGTGVPKRTFFRIPHTQTAKAQEPWGKKPVFRGVFRIREHQVNERPLWGKIQHAAAMLIRSALSRTAVIVAAGAGVSK